MKYDFKTNLIDDQFYIPYDYTPPKPIIDLIAYLRFLLRENCTYTYIHSIGSKENLQSFLLSYYRALYYLSNILYIEEALWVYNNIKLSYLPVEEFLESKEYKAYRVNSKVPLRALENDELPPKSKYKYTLYTPNQLKGFSKREAKNKFLKNIPKLSIPALQKRVENSYFFKHYIVLFTPFDDTDGVAEDLGITLKEITKVNAEAGKEMEKLGKKVMERGIGKALIKESIENRKNATVNVDSATILQRNQMSLARLRKKMIDGR